MNRPRTLAPNAFAVAAILLLGITCGACHTPLPRPPIPDGENPRRWQEAIDDFSAADQNTQPPAGPVVFTGSSSIRLWHSLTEDMAPIPVLNRGFGGSRLFDACYYSEQLVSRYRPSIAVVFSGTNDIQGETPKHASHVRDLFSQLVRRLHHEDAELRIVFIAITPTASRAHHRAIVDDANRLIRSFCARDDRLYFVDPTPDLQNTVGEPDPQYFRDDGLHLDVAGYAVWTEHIRPVVERLYTEYLLERRDG